MVRGERRLAIELAGLRHDELARHRVLQSSVSCRGVDAADVAGVTTVDDTIPESKLTHARAPLGVGSSMILLR